MTCVQYSRTNLLCFCILIFIISATGTKSLKKDKSMYMLTQMFLMLLLNSKVFLK